MLKRSLFWSAHPSFLLFFFSGQRLLLLFFFSSSFRLFFFSGQHLLLFFLVHVFFFFWFCFQHLPLFFLFFPPFFFPFSHYVLPFFSPRVEPKTCCPSSAQHVLILKPKSLSLFVHAFPFQFRPLSKPKGTHFSCQLLRSKRNFPLVPFIQDPIFFLAASRLFYLNKSSFSSNLQ